MHPAFSVIFLTTLIGVGQGLFLALYTGQFYSAVEVLPAQDGRGFYAVGSIIALLFLSGGLFASFFHLGHPERGWRAIAKWRTSWLSREVLLLPAFMGLVFLYALLHWFGWDPALASFGHVTVTVTLALGAFASLVCFALFVCTGMIYAAVKFIREWHCSLTVFNYILLGGASGFTLAAAYSAYTGVDLVGFFGNWAVVIALVGLLTRGGSLIRNARIRKGLLVPKSTNQSAVGIRHPRLTQRAMGFMGGSFNTREFFHGAGLGTMNSVQSLFLVLVFPLPIGLLFAAYLTNSELLPMLAFAVQYLGLILERWFFFAQATHPQNLYYQSIG